MGCPRIDRLPAERLGDGLRLAQADSARSRFLGVAWLDAMPRDAALRLSPCRSIHTLGMRFALDLIWLDADGTVLRIDRDVRPGRMRGCRRARTVIETVAGEADRFAQALHGPGD